MSNTKKKKNVQLQLLTANILGSVVAVSQGLSVTFLRGWNFFPMKKGYSIEILGTEKTGE